MSGLHRWQGKAKRLGGLEVDDRRELGRQRDPSDFESPSLNAADVLEWSFLADPGRWRRGRFTLVFP
jgi:hypothetical protein